MLLLIRKLSTPSFPLFPRLASSFSSRPTSLQTPPPSPQTPSPSDSHSPQGGIYSLESILAKQQAGEQLRARIQQLRQKHQLLRVSLQEKINIPYSLCGLNRKTYQEGFGYLPERVMSYYRIHPTTITDYLLKIYKAGLYAIVDGNNQFMEEYWEEGFREKAVEALHKCREQGVKVKVTEEKRFIAETRDSCKIVDAVMVRGLSTRRKENQPPNSYHRYSEADQFGLITYTPSYLTQDNPKFQDPVSNKTIYSGYQKMLLRVLLLVKTPLRLTVPSVPVPPELNTYEHLVVMQNEMQAPPHLQSRYKLQTLVEWLGKYRFGEWRVVDIDNFMRGNSPFREHQKNEDELEEIFKGTVMDRGYYCNIREF